MADWPLTSELGNLTCTAGSGDLLYLLGTAIRVGPDVATLNIESNEYDATTPTGSAVNFMTMNAGLRSATIDFTGIYPRAASPLGITSLITYASGYVKHVTAFNIGIEFAEFDATATTGAVGNWRAFRPKGTGRFNGSYTCLADNATPPTLPSSATAAAAATFKLAEDGASDPTLAGNITTPKLTQTVRIGDESVCVYTFTGSGDLTQTAGTALPGLTAASGAIVKPMWDLNSDGTADNTCVLTVASGRTYTGPFFWTRLNLAWAMDQPVRVTGTLRLAGSLTVA
jgi:hypothetical protein